MLKTGVFTYLNAILKNGSLYQADDECDSCTNQLVTGNVSILYNEHI